MPFLKSKCQQATSRLLCLWQCSGIPCFLYPSLSQICYISACKSLPLIWLTKKYFIFLSSGHETRQAAQLLQEALNHPLTTSVAEQYLKSLLHSACPALAPLVSLPSSLVSAAAGFSSLLLQEVTALTVWHMWQFWFMLLLSSPLLLTSCLSTHSDTHNNHLLWQNRGLQRFSTFIFFLHNF